MKKSRGFTLIELLIAIALAGSVGYLIIQALAQSNGLYYQQSVAINQGLSLNDASSLISSDIKSASAVANAYPSNPSVISSSTALVLQLPSLDSSGNVLDQTYDYEVIAPDSTNPQILRDQLYPDSLSSRKSLNRVLVTNLSSITFYYLNNSGQSVSPSSSSKVSFVLNLSSRLGSASQQGSASATINLRNL